MWVRGLQRRIAERRTGAAAAEQPVPVERPKSGDSTASGDSFTTDASSRTAGAPAGAPAAAAATPTRLDLARYASASESDAPHMSPVTEVFGVVGTPEVVPKPGAAWASDRGSEGDLALCSPDDVPS